MSMIVRMSARRPSIMSTTNWRKPFWNSLGCSWSSACSIRPPPPDDLPERAAEPDADAGADDQHHLLDRERLPALVGRVVVAHEAGTRRLADGLAEAEERPEPDEHREPDG